ncbi:F-box protein At5g07670 isoform X2 [Hevea brasiliensis]|uniref:F-box protein At5g07670 isoform X2 n=1 Tax=Hevea brasiliensis TaxID=3981 RepID=UPI000B78CA76|nr:F-box protein At5g07670 isoform X2 [Hevea brasiliensis]
MSFSAEEPTTDTNQPLKKRSPSWSDLWLKNTKPLKHVIFAMQLQSLSSPTPNKESKTKTQTLIPKFSKIDRTLLLSDELLLKILSKLTDSHRNHNFLVCKRWLNLQGRLVRSLKVLDWEFIESGRLIARFPNLTNVDLINGCIVTPHNSSIWLNHRFLSMNINFEISGFVPNWRICEENLLPVEVVDRGLQALASACPNLRKLIVIGASELGLLSVAEECLTLQELELHKCNDNVLRGIAACDNLQILKLVGNVDGLYRSLVSDIGLTILAQGCKRLVKLELSGCEGSFDGIKAIGQCCQMLEEFTLCDHRMDDGWLAALSYCENLKTLRFLSCMKIDPNPGPDEYLVSCPALEKLHLQKCQFRDKKSVRALFKVCEAVREIVVKDCWGLDNDMFSSASICRRVKLLSLEGCSLLTTQGLESILLTSNELQHLRVQSCWHGSYGDYSSFIFICMEEQADG